MVPETLRLFRAKQNSNSPDSESGCRSVCLNSLNGFFKAKVQDSVSRNVNFLSSFLQRGNNHFLFFFF